MHILLVKQKTRIASCSEIIIQYYKIHLWKYRDSIIHTRHQYVFCVLVPQRSIAVGGYKAVCFPFRYIFILWVNIWIVLPEYSPCTHRFLVTCYFVNAEGIGSSSSKVKVARKPNPAIHKLLISHLWVLK